MPPLFSVVIPTYNRAAKAVRAVRSILAQTLASYDIWVVDDGTDHTEEALRPFDGRMHYQRGPGAGVAAARNLGIASASGAYIAFLDADDWWHPHKLERTAEAIRRWPEAGLFYCRIECVSASGETLWRPRIRDVGGNGYPALLEGDFVANSAVVVKKECLERVGGFDTTLSGCEDWDLWIRVARLYPIRLVPGVLVRYEYLSEGSFTSRHRPWLEAQEAVITKALAADPALSPAGRRRIRAGSAYCKGRTCLGARDDMGALREFRQAVALHPAHWRAWLYIGVLSAPRLWRRLPRRLKRALRLPEFGR